MTSLSERLKRRASSTPSPATPSDSGAVLLPFDTARDLIEGHDVVVATGADARMVHAVLVKMHTYLTASLCKRGRGEQASRPPATPDEALGRGGTGSEGEEDPDVCPHYDVRLDEHEGIRMCVRCGAVRDQVLNCQPEYDLVHEQQQAQQDDAPRRLSRMRADLAHWNGVFTHLPPDRLSFFGTVAWECVLSGRRQPDNGTMVYPYEAILSAVLVYPMVQAQIDGVGRETRRRQSFEGRFANTPAPVLVDSTPKPHFACSFCGTGWHDRKSSRLCCRSRKRAEVVTLGAA